ncbi:MAG: hypothetical protein WCX93_10445, partial [Burkholderiaceae bacterium]
GLYVAYGTWNEGTFEIADDFNAETANDAMLIVADGNQTAIEATGTVILEDLSGVLTDTDFLNI